MARGSVPKAPSLALAIIAVFALAATTAAQNVIVDETFIQLWSAGGATVYLGQFGDLFLGGAGSSGSITLRDSDGTDRVFLDGGTADLFLGGGDDDGDLILRDTDGITTTVNLEGEFGLITLGGGDRSGTLTLWDDEPPNSSSISLSGLSGSLTNQVDGNGLVKAWALLEADGTLDNCYFCNPDPTKTFQTPGGRYRVDFDPLGIDLTARPILCQVDDLLTFLPKSVQCEWFGSTIVEVVVFRSLTTSPESQRIRVFVF